MAYATYITDALVCGVKNLNTSDGSFLLFTPDSGMIVATARSVREERSRQRYALQAFALVRVTLIRGKAGWRIGSVEALNNYYTQAVNKAARGSVVKLFRHLRRFVHGEETVPGLFTLSREALALVVNDVEHRHFLDQVIQLRMLERLGYISIQEIPPALLEAKLVSMGEVYQPSLEKQLDTILERSISASHL